MRRYWYLGRDRCGIVTFTAEGVDPDVVRAELAHRDVTVTTSTRASTRIDMERRDLAAVTRASPHYFVSDEEIDRAVDAVAEIVGQR